MVINRVFCCEDPLPFIFSTSGIPLMSSLVVRDHYSASADNQHPTFILHEAESSSENVWGHQMDQLFVFKMSELMRILFTMRLLKTGPEVEKGFTYSEVLVWRVSGYFFSFLSFYFTSFHPLSLLPLPSSLPLPPLSPPPSLPPPSLSSMPCPTTSSSTTSL